MSSTSDQSIVGFVPPEGRPRVATGTANMEIRATMKTTIELADVTFRRAKAFAAGRGITLKRFFTDAEEQELSRHTAVAPVRGARVDAELGVQSDPPWMGGFGGLADLGDDHRTVLDMIENEFEKLGADDIP